MSNSTEQDTSADLMVSDTYSLIPMFYKCLVCQADVGSDEITGVDRQGHPVTLYYPASRYWLSQTHPNKQSGVFCSAEHAAEYLRKSYQKT